MNPNSSNRSPPCHLRRHPPLPDPQPVFGRILDARSPEPHGSPRRFRKALRQIRVAGPDPQLCTAGRYASGPSRWDVCARRVRSHPSTGPGRFVLSRSPVLSISGTTFVTLKRLLRQPMRDRLFKRVQSEQPASEKPTTKDVDYLSEGHRGPRGGSSYSHRRPFNVVEAAGAAALAGVATAAGLSLLRHERRRKHIP